MNNDDDGMERLGFVSARERKNERSDKRRGACGRKSGGGSKFKPGAGSQGVLFISLQKEKEHDSVIVLLPNNRPGRGRRIGGKEGEGGRWI